MLVNKPLSTLECHWLGSEVGNRRPRCYSRSRQWSWRWSRGQLIQAEKVWLRADTHLSIWYHPLLQHRWSSQTCIIKKYGQRMRPDLSVRHRVFHLGCDVEGGGRAKYSLTGVNYSATEEKGERLTLNCSHQSLPAVWRLHLLKMSDSSGSVGLSKVSLHSHVTESWSIW